MQPPTRPPLPHHRLRVLLVCAGIALVAACGGAPASPTGSSGSPSPAVAVVGRTASPTAPPATTAPARVIPPISSGAAPSTAPPGSQAAVAEPQPAATSPAKRFAIDLFRRGDFVSQARSDWCVPASIQLMARVIDPVAARSLPGQRALDRQARALSSSRLVGRGSEPQGWAGVLNRHGDGRYEVAAFRSRAAAVRTAARALRLTGRPVGLLMWHGAHAWVMTGFTATADPALANGFRVTSVRISDPWYPRPTSAFGRTHRPDERLSVARLALGFLRWRRPLARYAELDGRFVLILPIAGATPRGPAASR